jgi:glutamate carboxypeptidase
MPVPSPIKNIFEYTSGKLPQMISVLRRFVICESPSLEKAAADRCCGVIASEWKKRDVRIERVANKERGDLLRLTWWPGKSRPQGQLLVLGHYDTVYASGTLAKMPFRVSGGKVYGPGTFDMKTGIVQALFALEALQKSGRSLRKRVVFLWTSDEEIGSEASRQRIEIEAKRSDAVFVLEPAFGQRGLLKTERKGVGEAEIIAYGRASHAGLAPEQGVNAIEELARQIWRVHRWRDLGRGTTIAACMVDGGTRTNVIPERARAVLDLRALRIADMRRLEQRLRKLRPFLPGARLEIRGGFSRPPLEGKSSAALFTHAKALAAQMGFALSGCSVGGGSDGNFTAALGVPTLDGLGAVGDGAHSAHEHVILRSMPARAALLAALLMNC